MKGEVFVQLLGKKIEIDVQDVSNSVDKLSEKDKVAICSLIVGNPNKMLGDKETMKLLREANK